MNPRWYIIHAYSGSENKVREAIHVEAERMGLAELIERIEVPTETVTEVKRGKRVQSERTSMAGYVLAKLVMTDDVYHLIRNTPKVTGFLGVAGKPQAVRESEAMRLMLESCSVVWAPWDRRCGSMARASTHSWRCSEASARWLLRM